MRRVWRVIASFGGLGYIPIAPGTAASLAVVLLYKFLLSRFSWPYLVLLLLFLFALGVISSTAYAAELAQKDPQKIVVDEAVGQLIVLLFIFPSWTLVLLSFLLFRFFDIVKPFPVSRAERLPVGWGIMADDVAAALLAKALLHLYIWIK
jgi:phosphatidylglycerophosphatase A